MERTLFDDEHEQFRQSFRRWLAKEVVPFHLEWEDAGIIPREVFLAAGDHGFLGTAVPAEYGGGGVDDFRYNLVIGEEVQAAGVNAAGLAFTLQNDI
jgi:alkylation response protein AidB-like acyl-CoA dehydrogenase